MTSTRYLSSLFTSGRFLSPLIWAMVFFLLYFVVAWRQGNFVMHNFYYWDEWWTLIFGVPYLVVQSMFWKIFLLVPGTILLSIALTRAGLEFPKPKGMNHRLIIGIVLVTAIMILILSTQLLFQETEVTSDELVYDFQAQTLLAGRIVNPPPPVPGRSIDDPMSGETSFDNDEMINDGRVWVGKYGLGHPVVIALGMAVGNRYVVIIGISVFTLLLIYLIAKELYGDKTVALLSFLFGSVSPFFYIVSSSRLSHTTSAFLLALFAYLLLRLRNLEKRTQEAAVALLAGLVLGYAFNVRPLTALGFALPFFLLWAFNCPQFPRRRFSDGLIVIAGFSFVVALTLSYNFLITGNILKFPFHYFSSWQRVGFTSVHTPFQAMHNFAMNFARMNWAFLGFPLSLMFVLVFCFAKKEFGDRLLFGIMGSFVLGYAFYFSTGIQDLGPIYYYELLTPLAILSARGFLFLREVLAEHFERGKTFLSNFLIVSCIVAYVTYVPERVSHIARLTRQVRTPYEAVRAANIHHALVIIARSWHGKGHVPGYRNPSPALDDDIIYCRWSDSTNHAIVGHFSDRTPYVLKYDKAKDHIEVLPLDRRTLQPLALLKDIRR